jgi:TLC domain
MLSPRTLAVSFAVWEALYWVFYLALRSPGAQRRFTPVVCRDAPAYIVSTIHAAFASARGVRHLVRLWAAPNVVKLCIPPRGSVTPAAAQFLPEAYSVIVTNVSLAGYLLSDLLHVVWQYPNLGKKDTIAHHVAFLSCALVAGYQQLYPFAFAWLIIGEASTPVLNLRWYLIRQGHGASKLLVHVSIVFAATFFVTRFCIYGSGLVHLYQTYWQMPGDVRGAMSATVWAFLIFGFMLNLVWLKQIVALGSARPRPKKTVDEAGPEQRTSPESDPTATAKAGKAK